MEMERVSHLKTLNSRWTRRKIPFNHVVYLSTVAQQQADKMLEEKDDLMKLIVIIVRK